MDEGTSVARPVTTGPGSATVPLEVLGRCMDSLDDIVLVTDAEPFDSPGSHIVYVNEAFQRQTGYTLAEVVGKTPRLLQGPKTDRSELLRVSTAMRRWEAVRAEFISYTKDGRELHVEMDIVPVAGASGVTTHWVTVQRNVTAHKLAERQARLRDVQRLDSVATLAAGIAHDFNNIVATILGNVAIARLDIATGHSGVASLEQINTAALRARVVIQRTLVHGGRQPRAFVRELLCPIVQESTELLRAALPAGIELRVTLSEEALEILADATQLQQVLLDLGTNAWHAMRGGRGSIEVDCRPGTAQDVQLLGPARRQATPGRCAVIRFSDDGCGMDAATAARVFDPYFTTKAVGHGTGPGLFAASGIVEAHHGRITVRTAPGTGSSFYVVLPLVDDTTASQHTQAPPAAGLGDRRDRVMVVDDDEMVLLMLGTLLSRAGFRVVSFNDPVTALQTLAQRAPEFDIVVTDHTMPILSGMQLVHEIATRWPALPVVFASGYLDDAVRAEAHAAGAAAVIGKEFAADELAGLLRTLLQHRSSD